MFSSVKLPGKKKYEVFSDFEVSLRTLYDIKKMLIVLFKPFLNKYPNCFNIY